MPSKNIECQLAQGQIGRYLNGERFSPQAIQQLEAHVADCDECTELVARRKQALLTMLGGDPTRAAVMTNHPSQSEKSEVAAQRLVAEIGKKNEEAPVAPVAKSTNSLLVQLVASKPLLYGTALAAVLLAISWYGKSLVKSLGPTSAEVASVPVTPEPKARVQPILQSQPAPLTPVARTEKPIAASPLPKPAKPPSGRFVKIHARPAVVATHLVASVVRDEKLSRPVRSRSNKPRKHVARSRVHRPIHRRVLISARVRRSRPPRSRFVRAPLGHRTTDAGSGAIRIYDAQGHSLQ